MRSFIVAGLLGASVACTGAVAPGSSTIEISGPTIVGFFPPLSEADFENIPGASEGLAHLQFALSGTSRCLNALDPDVHLELADELVFVIDGNLIRVSLPGEPRDVGAYLLLPGREPRAVYASMGPSSLQQLIPDAAAEYFGVEECRYQP